MKLTQKDILYVAIQLLLFIVYLFDVDSLKFIVGNTVSIIALAICIFGMVLLGLALLQLNTNLSPFPSPKSSSNLITNGLYKYVRHPIYTGILLMVFSYAFHTGSTYRILISIGLLILFHFKSKFEEEKLSQKFKSYSNYIKKTGRFFPKL